MKNKIIAGVIAILFLPALIAVCWAVEQFLLVGIVLGIVLMSLITVLAYKIYKLLLDECSENEKDNEKSRKNNQRQEHTYPGQIQED